MAMTGALLRPLSRTPPALATHRLRNSNAAVLRRGTQRQASAVSDWDSGSKKKFVAAATQGSKLLRRFSTRSLQCSADAKSRQFGDPTLRFSGVFLWVASRYHEINSFTL